jgi:GNAT superfamily N-acetyltransferase
VAARPAAPAGGAVRIRELRRSDRDSFFEVLLGSYGPFEAMLGLGTQGTAEFSGLFRPGIWFVLQFLRAFGLAPIRMFVAVEGPTVVGTALVLPWPNSGYILGVGVRPSHRRRGWAGRMIGRAEELSAKHRRDWAVLDVEEENHAAVALYRARQYAPIQSAVWLRCATPEALAAAPRAPASVQVVAKGGRKAAAARCAELVPASLTAILPPNPTRLSHLESLGQFPGTVRETWSVGPPDRPVGYVSACWRGKGRPGILFLPALDPAASREEVVRLVQEGTAWLASRGGTVVLAAVPDSVGSAIPILESLGFSRQLSTWTMARRLRLERGSTSAPKGP